MHPLKKTARIAGAIYLINGLHRAIHSAVCPRQTHRARRCRRHRQQHPGSTRRCFVLRSSVISSAHVIFICHGHRALPVAEQCRQDMGSVDESFALVSVSAAVGFLDTLNDVAALILLRGADFLSVFDKAQLRRAGLSVHPPARPGDLHERALLGSVAFFLRTAGISRSGFLPRFILAVGSMINCFGHVALCLIALPRPGLLRRCVSLGAASLVWRTGNHALASDQRRKGASSSNEASPLQGQDGWRLHLCSF